MNIAEYKTIMTLQEFCEREKIKSSNARKFWLEGKRTYLKECEDAKRLGRDWFVFAK